MKILIAGGGKVGETLVRQLTAEGHDITLIDSTPSVIENVMEHYDIIGVSGNAASMETLLDADVRHAHLMIAVTNADEVNLLACMTAHGLNKDLHTIARIRNPEYRAQSYQMRDYFGLNMVINPEETAAVEIARLLQFPGFSKIDLFAKGATEIAELKIKAESPLNHLVLNKLNSVVHSQVLVCAVQRDGVCIMPDGNFTLQEDDVIYVTASQADLARMLRHLGVLNKKAKTALITGGGRISYYLSKELEKGGIAATVVEQDADRCSELATSLPQTTIVHGNASSQAFLDREGIETYDALITMTNLDELNIVMSLYGNARGVPQIITKLSHAENNKILDRLPIGSVISPKELICSGIVRYVRAMQNKVGAAITIHMIAGGQGEAIEFIVDDKTKYTGVALKDISLRRNVLIASIERGWKHQLPTGTSTFQPGDTIIVVTTSDTRVQQLNDIFEE